LRFEAKDLMVKLFSAEDGLMACGVCDSTAGKPNPNPGKPCPPPSKPCFAASKPACPQASKKAGAAGEGDLRLAGLTALRRQLHTALSQP
jgi:hypothetical protein